MKLTQAEKDSALWLKIRTELQARLATLREENDKDKNLDETNKQRGRIGEVKLILSWEQEPPKFI